MLDWLPCLSADRREHYSVVVATANEGLAVLAMQMEVMQLVMHWHRNRLGKGRQGAGGKVQLTTARSQPQPGWNTAASPAAWRCAGSWAA